VFWKLSTTTETCRCCAFLLTLWVKLLQSSSDQSGLTDSHDSHCISSSIDERSMVERLPSSSNLCSGGECDSTILVSYGQESKKFHSICTPKLNTYNTWTFLLFSIAFPNTRKVEACILGGLPSLFLSTVNTSGRWMELQPQVPRNFQLESQRLLEGNTTGEISRLAGTSISKQWQPVLGRKSFTISLGDGSRST